MCTACGALVGQSKEGGTKTQAGSAARQSYLMPSPSPALLLLCVLLVVEECTQKQVCREVILGRYKRSLGIRETKHRCPAVWLPSAVVFVIHHVSTRFLKGDLHLHSQVLKFHWRTETEWEMGYKQRETAQGAKISERSWGIPYQKPEPSRLLRWHKVRCGSNQRGQSTQPHGVRVGCNPLAFSQSRGD